MTVTAWNEPEGGTPRGTLVVLPGRGETPATYARFGRRISADAWRVRLVPTDLDDLETTRAEVEKVLADETLPSPKVLVGADSGATVAALLGRDLPVDAVVLAGLVLPDSTGVESWEDEIAARTACPVHTRVIGEDDSFARGALNATLPWGALSALGDLGAAPERPTLVLHGTADPVTPSAAVVARFEESAPVRLGLVDGGRHDILNDASHRSVAATVVLFLESLRLGAELPEIVRSGR